MIPSRIPRRPVKSSNLKQVGYDPLTQDLVIEFHSGTMYLYKAIPTVVHTDLMAAKSKGKFFNEVIRNRFLALPVSKV
jgi:hypothetical protein